MTLYILRGTFILLTASVTMLYVLPFQASQSVLLPAQDNQSVQFSHVLLMTLLTLGVTGVIVAADIFTPRKKLSAMSGVFLGLLAGLLAAYALSFVVDLIGLLVAPAAETERKPFLDLLQGVKVLIGLLTCYMSISLVVQTKDDFRFVIPYVEFAKQIRGQRPILLDTSIIIDGRIVDLAESQVMQGQLIVPRFVLEELQTIADSADSLRRARGRRGLDTLQKLQDNPKADILIEDRDAEGHTVDQKLVALGQELHARIMTNDFNLSKIAGLRDVDVINLNEVATALRPVALPGEPMQIKIIKPGEAANQGVGYLDDGTMVVVERARQQIGKEVQVIVTSTLQTSAGRMIFARYDNPTPGSAPQK